eukprot:scaffold402615_cov47-Prasinocladus_malaysianus.AAC.1
MSRRDLRPGWQRGIARRPADDKIELTVELGPSEGWKLTEEYTQSSPNELCIKSTVVAASEEASFTTWYTRGHD